MSIYCLISDVFMPCEYSCHAACYPIYTLLFTLLQHLVYHPMPARWVKQSTFHLHRLALLLFITCIVALLILEDKKQLYIQGYRSPWVISPLAHTVREQYNSTVYSVYMPDCDMLFDGDKWELELTQRMLYAEQWNPIHHQPKQLFCESKNLVRLRDYNILSKVNVFTKISSTQPHEHNETESSLSNETVHHNSISPVSMNSKQLAVIIHIEASTSVEQTVMLLDTIYHSNDVYCIVIYQNTAEMYWKILHDHTYCKQNIFILPKMYHSAWTKLETELLCITHLIQKKSTNWSHVLNLDASSFPVIPVQRIRQRIFSMRTQNIKVFHRIRQVQWNPQERNVSNESRTELKHHYGSPYFIMTRQYVEHCITKQLPHVTKLLKNIENSPLQYIAPEIFWSTLYERNKNANETSSLEPYIHHQTKWKIESLAEHLLCMYNINDTSLIRHIYMSSNWVQNHSSSVYDKSPVSCTYTVTDLTHLKQHTYMFTSKFDINSDHCVIECVKQRIA